MPSTSKIAVRLLTASQVGGPKGNNCLLLRLVRIWSYQHLHLSLSISLDPAGIFPPTVDILCLRLPPAPLFHQQHSLR